MTVAPRCRVTSRMTYLAGEVRLHHQEDLAQALGLDWRDIDVKFQKADWPTDPKRATARRIGELLGSISGGDTAVELWVRQPTYHLAIGNNDAHAKNVALMHRTKIPQPARCRAPTWTSTGVDV